jgi:hypothetical protein
MELYAPRRSPIEIDTYGSIPAAPLLDEKFDAYGVVGHCPIFKIFINFY